MDTQRRFEVLKDLFEANKKSVAFNGLKYNIKALVGLRRDTGYFTAETFILNDEKSTAGETSL